MMGTKAHTTQLGSQRANPDQKIGLGGGLKKINRIIFW